MATDSSETPFIVASPSMQKVLLLLPRVAASTASVLITGETGTGKELIARAVHLHSPRRGRQWVAINCAAIPEYLLESELFGYEKGAFSGAESSKKGLFELADGGTILLDEIGEFDPKLQVKLLRVLDGAPYYRLGGNRKISVDVKVIAATNKPLEQLVQTGAFRRDLYHRLSQFHLKIPPLRERLEDITALADHFLSRLAPEKRFSQQAKDRLLSYHWPGNIRELESVVLQAATFREEQEISAECLWLEKEPAVEPAGWGASQVAQAAAAGASPGVVLSAAPMEVPVRQAGPHDLSSLERQAIIDALTTSGGHQGITALELGISRRTLSRKLKLYNIDPVRSHGKLQSDVAELGGDQQLRFRYSLEIPVEIASGGEHFQFRSRNVSCGGVCVQSAYQLPKISGTLSIRFRLPECSTLIEVTGRIVWTDRDGTVGIRFTNAPQHTQIALNQWLKEKQEVEGWL
ncbi:MAG: sigma 54-interacting transcriptional regulator [Candidatus Korobacteraceae bacterium]|jgi:DNA-binding NtrC family response regulator